MPFFEFEGRDVPGLEIVVSVLAGFAVPAIGWWRTSQDLRKERELDNEPFLIGWEVTRKIIIGNLALPHWPFKIAVNDKKIEDLHMFFVDVSNVGTQDISHPVELIISVRRHFIAKHHRCKIKTPVKRSSERV